MGKYENGGKAGLLVIGSVLDPVIEETRGLSWGDQKMITQDAGGHYRGNGSTP